MQFYAITDRNSLGPHETERTNRLLTLVTGWARGGVDFLQIREKDLGPSALLELSQRIVEAAWKTGAGTRVLLNGGAGIAAQAGADGVHLPGTLATGDVERVCRIWRSAGRSGDPVVSVACHSIADVECARAEGARMALFAPVFGKRLDSGEMHAGVGLAALGAACRAAGDLPVLALGGVTAVNAESCIAAGASGIAAIRLFADDEWIGLRLP